MNNNSAFDYQSFFCEKTFKGKKYENVLYKRYFTFDVIKKDESRTVMGLFTVIGTVGGVQQVFIVIASLLIASYSHLCFTISLTNDLFSVETKDDSLELENEGLVVGSFDKLKLITNIKPN